MQDILSKELEFIALHKSLYFIVKPKELEIKNHVANIDNWEYSSYIYIEKKTIHINKS